MVFEEPIPEPQKCSKQPRIGRSGSVEVLVANIFAVTKTVFGTFTHFECSEDHLKSENDSLSLLVNDAGKEFTKEVETLLLHRETSEDKNLEIHNFIIWSKDNFSNTE